MLDRMDDRHGKFKSRLGLFGHLYGGGDKGDYGDSDIASQHKLDTKAYNAQEARGLLASQFADIDMDNPSMADVATITKLDAGLGELALKDFGFNRRVSDLGRARDFMNDGLDDDNQLWAEETFQRYGKTSGGQNSTLTNTLQKAGYTQAEFDGLPTESKRRVLYQYGTDEDRKAQDKVAGRQTLEEIENEAAAAGRGTASGEQTAEAIGFLPNAPQIAADQDRAIAGTQGLIDMIKGGEIDTGMIPNFIKETFNVQTKADGTLSYQSTQALIKAINSATFGALSENEMTKLGEMFANGSYNEEQNLGILESVMGKLNHEKEGHKRKTDESIRRVKRYAPDEYEYFMQDDDNYLTYGEGAERKPVQMSAGGEMSYPDFYRDGIANGKSRDEIDVGYNTLRKREQAAVAEREKALEEQAKLAEQAREEMRKESMIMNDPAQPNSPFGRKK
jgi:hypothetical protein